MLVVILLVRLCAGLTPAIRARNRSLTLTEDERGVQRGTPECDRRVTGQAATACGRAITDC
jgi:hypothetical protein